MTEKRTAVHSNRRPVPPATGDAPIVVAPTAIRTYLRLLVGAPVSRSVTLEQAEREFVELAAAWAAAAGVDRRTLTAIGVPAAVLDRAGLRPTAAADVVRLYYPETTFTVAALAARTGFSTSTVRKTIVEDDAEGRISRVDGTGAAVQYRAN